MKASADARRGTQRVIRLKALLKTRDTIRAGASKLWNWPPHTFSFQLEAYAVRNATGAQRRRHVPFPRMPYLVQELVLSTVTARRFCDQQEISLHTATGRSLP